VKLELSDIVDLRAYERDRPDLQRRVFALKRRRRVAVGPIVTLLFENRDTIRFQIQEMARAEKMLRDEQILEELEIYNPLIPEAGELSATLFVELTSKAELEEWLPKLVGIERAVELRFGDGDTVTAEPEAAHDEQLTRDDVTASVHYIRFQLTPEQVERFASGPARLAINHPAYKEEVVLNDDTQAELLRRPGRGGHMAQDERVSDATHEADRRDAEVKAHADREPTPDEEREAEKNKLDPGEARTIKEQYERGANAKGEGRVEP
jgi:hypothetical protein